MSIIKGIEEKILIERIIEGDQTAFELLFRFYYPGLVVFARQIVLNLDEAEEIVQDFFVQLWVGRKKIKNASTLKNYLFVSVKNRAFNFLKKEQIREKVLNELRQMIETDILYQPDLFVVSELQEQINNAFSKLPDRTHEIFQLSRLKGLSNTEIATQLNLSKRTVETQISNALKILRAELKNYLFFLMLI
ncbi:MAG: RNA polymerase sigma-70 factor [Prolixibacteraceae bacterium]|nr:RNA polymerase sigma-70 factor [Prolixibacteraceae bacterium]